MKRMIKASHMVTSGVSFDFVWDDDYDGQAISTAMEQAFDELGLEMKGIDFYSVDYSMYPEYADKNVSQCGIDFDWEDDYDQDEVSTHIHEVMQFLGYEIAGEPDFYTI